MKKGFTLLELIVVIIILGILATLAVTQYQGMIERSRGAEARNIIGSIRSNAAAIYMRDNNNCTNCTAANVGIAATGDYPGPAAANCRTSNYWWYNVAAGANGVTVTATRCLAGGKAPDGTGVAGTIALASNFTAAGSDVWTVTGQY